jgi:radical SAM protein with 4Fe4S-binding SPASM domain
MYIKSTIRDRLNLISSLNFPRVFNLFKIVSSYYLSVIIRYSYHRGKPYSITIEPTTNCNLHCPECPTGQRMLTRPKGDLRMELYKKTIDELDRDLIYLLLYFQGEPYLNRQFLDFVRYAKSKKIYTATSTNAHYLNDETSRKTVESGLDRIIISMDGTTQEVYESYRIGGELNKVISGINNLVKWKKALNSSKPYIVLQFLVLKTNEHQIKEIKKFARQSGIDELQLKSAQITSPQPSPNGEGERDMIPSDKKYSRYVKQADGTYRIKNKLKNRCLRMWTSSVISWDGNVIPCCFDKDARYTFGNSDSENFQSIWKNKKYEDFRKRVLNQRKSIDICKNCTSP